MRDLLLNDDHDLPVKGDLEWTEGLDAVHQRIKIRLLLFSGRYFMDTEIGIPYESVVLVRNPSLQEIRNVYRGEIGDVPGVESVESISADFDAAQRTLSLEFTALLLEDSEEESVISDVQMDLGLGGGATLLLFDARPSI